MTDESGNETAERPGIGRERQSEIYISGLAGESPEVPIDLRELEAEARRSMSEEAYAYIAGGAGTESTILENREAFERHRIVPRMMRDVSTRDTSVEIFGRRWSSPFFLSPIGVLEMVHEQADVAVGRGAVDEDVPMLFSNQASRSMEEVSRAMDEVVESGDETRGDARDGERWFQLYWSKSDDLVESLVRRAEACGCGAIVVTLDTTLLGWRTRDLDLAYLPFLRGLGIAQYTSDPVFNRLLERDTDGSEDLSEERKVNLSTLRVLLDLVTNYPDTLIENVTSGKPLKAVQTFIDIYSRPSLTWEDLPFLQDLTDLPIVLKGILDPADATEAVQRGVDGLIVSNHGGRQVDGAVAAIDALPAVVEAVDGAVPVLMDSGIRTGADAFKALALGAEAVGIGRPYCYGLAVDGREGVRQILRNLKADFDLTMGLAGCRSVGEITAERVRARGAGIERRD